MPKYWFAINWKKLYGTLVEHLASCSRSSPTDSKVRTNHHRRILVNTFHLNGRTSGVQAQEKLDHFNPNSDALDKNMSIFRSRYIHMIINKNCFQTDTSLIMWANFRLRCKAKMVFRVFRAAIFFTITFKFTVSCLCDINLAMPHIFLPSFPWRSRLSQVTRPARLSAKKPSGRTSR